MCNHYRNLPGAIDDWAVWAGYKPRLPGEPVQEELWPKRAGHVVRRDGGELIVDVMQWGVPRTMKGKSGKPIETRVTNVRNLTSPFWKSMLASPDRRCLVPFTEFAEPKPGKDPVTGRPAEYWFSRVDRAAGAFAGIWRPSEHGNVYAFLTCEPNALVGAVHPKAMPVILHDEDYARWLDAGYDEACALAAPYPSQLMARA